MKSYDVFLDSFVNVMVPDSVDPDTEEGMKILYKLAIEKYTERMKNESELCFTWERYEDGDIDV